MKASRLLAGLILGILVSQKCFAGTVVQFLIFKGVFTYMGEVDVELYDQDKPITVKNFLDLIEVGAYDDGFFHRLQPNFVLQGGSYSTVNPLDTTPLAPPFFNIYNEGNFGNITNEFNVGKFYSNTNWTIAMGKVGNDPNSANSGFFFNLADNSGTLDNTNNAGGFVVFGHVLKGSNVLNQFNSWSYGTNLVNLDNIYGSSGVFTQLPNSLISSNAPPYDDLIYFEATTLAAQINLTTNGQRQISCPTISGVTNIVEYSTNLPPVWQTLFSTNGDGNPLTVTDSTTNNKSRFYRVHVVF